MGVPKQPKMLLPLLTNDVLLINPSIICREAAIPITTLIVGAKLVKGNDVIILNVLNYILARPSLFIY